MEASRANGGTASTDEARSVRENASVFMTSSLIGKLGWAARSSFDASRSPDAADQPAQLVAVGDDLVAPLRERDAGEHRATEHAFRDAALEPSVEDTRGERVASAQPVQDLDRHGLLLSYDVAIE